MGTFDVLFVGLGEVAEAHALAYAALGDVRIVAGVDPDENRRRHFAEHWGVPCHASVDEALSACDPALGLVLSPTGLHRQGVESLAGRAIPVLCEKPMALSLEDAKAMIDACAEADVLLAYGSSYRYLEPILEARRRIRDGHIGDVRMLSEVLFGGSGEAGQTPRSTVHYPAGGPGGTPMGMLDHGIHMFDVLPWLASQRPVSIAGRGNVAGARCGPEWAALTLDGGAVALVVIDDGTFALALPNEGMWGQGEGWALDGRRAPAGSWTRTAVEIRVNGSTGALRILPYAHRLFEADAAGLREIPINGEPAPAQYARQLTTVRESLDGGAPFEADGYVGMDALRLFLELDSTLTDA